MKMFPEMNALTMRVDFLGGGCKGLEDIRKLKDLRFLDLTKSFVTTKELGVIGKCVELKELSLSGCRFDRTKQELDMKVSKERDFYDSLFVFLERLQNLEKLDLSYFSVVNGASLKCVAMVKSLKVLNLRGCKKLESNHMMVLACLMNLQVLDVFDGVKLREEERNFLLFHLKNLHLITWDEPVKIGKYDEQKLSICFEKHCANKKKIEKDKKLDYQYQRQKPEECITYYTLKDEQSF